MAKIEIADDVVLRTKIGGKDGEAFALSAEELAACGPKAIEWLLQAGFGRLHAVKLNTVAVSEGKGAAFAAMLKRMRAGDDGDFEGARAPAQSADPVRDLARRKAKGVLAAMFKKRTGRKSLALAMEDPAVAAFFRREGVWDDEKVDAWIAMNAAKRDFRAEAQAEIDSIGAMGDDLTL